MDEQPTVTFAPGAAQPWPLLQWMSGFDIDGVPMDYCRVQKLYVHPTFGPRLAAASQGIDPAYREKLEAIVQADLLLEVDRFIASEISRASLIVVPPVPAQAEIEYEFMAEDDPQEEVNDQAA